MGFTRKVTFTNGVWTNLLTALKTKGYKTAGSPSNIRIFNSSATPLYLHLSNSGAQNPNALAGVAAAEGLPIGSAAAHQGMVYVSDRGANIASLDVGTTWLIAVGADVDAIIVIAG